MNCTVYTHTVPNLVLDKERVCYSYGNLIIRLHLPRLPARISPTKKEQNAPTSSLHVFNNSRLLRIKNSLSILSRYEFIPETHRHSHWTRLSNNMKVLDREAHVGLIFYVDMKKILSGKICPMARD
jgi:hypothetical protein